MGRNGDIGQNWDYQEIQEKAAWEKIGVPRTSGKSDIGKHVWYPQIREKGRSETNQGYSEIWEKGEKGDIGKNSGTL